MNKAAAISLTQIRQELKELANPEDAVQQARYFKTGPGEYGEGDRFIGIRVPVLRRLAKQYQKLSLEDTLALLGSTIHEHRLLALLILIQLYQRGDETMQRKIYRAYLKMTAHINNWDLVDVSAPRIVGAWLYDHAADRPALDKLAASRDLWRKRIAIMATLHFIQQGRFDETLRLAKKLLADPHDLIHKAVGWMLREVGKRDRSLEIAFLDRHISCMHRTTLRYAIEKFPPTMRQKYLKR